MVARCCTYPKSTTGRSARTKETKLSRRKGVESNLILSSIKVKENIRSGDEVRTKCAGYTLQRSGTLQFFLSSSSKTHGRQRSSRGLIRSAALTSHACSDLDFYDVVRRPGCMRKLQHWEFVRSAQRWAAVTTSHQPDMQ
jgi:hypothetical protein